MRIQTGVTPQKLERCLRAQALPVIARIQDNHVLFDIRTVADDQLDALCDTVRSALGAAQ